jgi:hypothetical protein
MHYRLIACEVLAREVGVCLQASPHYIDIEFTSRNEHARVDDLRGFLQSKVDDVEGSGVVYDAILLGFGLCGNATANLVARSVPIVMPRAHDCCTLFLGSRLKFKQYFQENPSQPFHSAGFDEHPCTERSPVQVNGWLPPVTKGDTLGEKYGAEDARELGAMLDSAAAAHPVEYYIDIPETQDLDILKQCRTDARKRRRHLEVIPGDLRLIRKLLYGQWAPSEFLIVRPGQRSAGTYDWEKVVEART